MSNREDSVYLAKLAEQAERYEGMFFFSLLRHFYFNALMRL